LPKIFNVNWFRKDENGKWLWPGYGDNMRVLAWIFGRCEGTAAATETAIGFVPTVDGIDISGLDVTKEDIAELVKVDKALWKEELELIKEQQASLGERYPNELKLQVEQLEARLG